MRHTITFVLLALLVVVLALNNMVNESKPDNEIDKFKTEGYALRTAQDGIKKKLKAPSTAEFPGLRESEVTREGPDVFIVKSYVDAQNSFGAKIRNHFTVKVEFTGDQVSASLISFD